MNMGAEKQKKYIYMYSWPYDTSIYISFLLMCLFIFILHVLKLL